MDLPRSADGVAPEIRAEIGRVAAGGELLMEFQPIFDLELWRGGEKGIVGFEALARFEDGARPDVVLDVAATMGLRTALELTAIRYALLCLRELPPETYLTVNVSPPALAGDGFAQMLTELHSLRGLVIEMPEQALVDLSEDVRSGIDQMRSRGLRMSVDDVGVGPGDLGLAMQLGADVIKMDRSVTRGIDTDPIRQYLAKLLVSLAKGSKGRPETAMVAAGIETSEELATLSGLGVPYGQGYWLARPGPLAHWLD